MGAKGKKYGRALVRACPEALDGRILTGIVVAGWANFDGNLVGQGALPIRSPEPMIEGVTVKAVTAQQGSLCFIVELDQPPTYGFPLVGGESINLQIDRLSKVNVHLPTMGDSVVYCAIAAAED